MSINNTFLKIFDNFSKFCFVRGIILLEKLNIEKSRLGSRAAEAEFGTLADATVPNLAKGTFCQSEGRDNFDFSSWLLLEASWHVAKRSTS